ncbi:MAG TPA: TRAP transporter substrate-binding protein DctP [Alphaproteobacteria bacterium]|nr:TRAP transporter substrate-binding protein DctP [Alphaproteobacteria bacterium]
MPKRPALALAAALLLAALPAYADKITLRLADGMPSGHIIDRTIIEPFIQQVAEATHGQVEIRHFPAEQLGKSRDMLMVTQAGVADIGFIVPSYQSDRMPLATVTELPGIFQTSCQGDAALRALTADGAILDEREFKPNGVKPLIIFLMPAYQLILSSGRPLGALKDAAGLKIRTPGGAMDLTVMGLGAVPIRMGPAEIYESMSRGTLDGALLAYQSVMSYHLAPLVKSGTLGQDFGTVAVTFSIRLKTWNALPPDVRDTLGRVGQSLSLQACEKFDKAEQDSIAKVRAGGVHLITPGAGDHADLEAAFARVREDWARRLDARGKAGTEIVKAFMDAADVAKPQ